MKAHWMGPVCSRQSGSPVRCCVRCLQTGILLITGSHLLMQVMVLKEEVVLGQPDKALPLTLAAEAAHAGGTPNEFSKMK